MTSLLESERLVSREITEAIKSELKSDLEGRISGVANPDLSKELLFLCGKKGKGEFYWGWMEHESEEEHNFSILGNPIEWIRLFRHFRDLNGHNAHAEFKFSSYKIESRVEYKGVTRVIPAVIKNWSFRYTPFGEIAAPSYGNKGMELVSFRGTFFDEVYGKGTETAIVMNDGVMRIGDRFPNPLKHMSPEQVMEFYRSFVEDLSFASPTAARFIGEKLPSLKLK